MKQLRVYLSSTFEDLKQHRAAVFAALERAGLEVTRMEGYVATDARPLELCLRDVGQCDVYVGLIGWRYGYQPSPAHGNPEARSITELEYRHAASKKIPTLLFLAAPDTEAGWPERFVDRCSGEGERGARVDALRAELGREETISFFRSPEELATLVLAALVRQGLSGRPYTVPRLPEGTLPRPAQQRALVQALQRGGHVLVQGPGGYGKTQLALLACHSAEIIHGFPGGLLWVSLGERPNLRAVLRDLCVAVTREAPQVTGLEALTQTLAASLGGQHCLLVVDDVWRADDLQPFLQLPGCTLLVTSRVRNLIEQAGQHGWADVPVDEMDRDEAAALLGRGCTPDEAGREALRELAERLGCWPLLLALAQARLAEQVRLHAQPLPEAIALVRELYEHKGVLGFDQRNASARDKAVARSVAVGLEHAEEQVPGLAARAAELAAFPEDVPIPLQALAALWGIDEFDVEEEVVRPLHNLALVNAWDRAARTLVLHDMLRRALQARIPDAAAVHHRLLEAWGDPLALPDDYAWRWYGWHCVRAGEGARLQQRLLDFAWLQAKLQATDIDTLCADFERMPLAAPATRIRSALLLSAHILARHKDLLAGHLLGRLQHEGAQALPPDAALQAFTDGVCRAMRGRRWLRPLTASLVAPGGALVRSFESTGDGSDWLCAVCTSVDGKRAVTASRRACVLHLWDLGAGRLRRSIVLEGGEVGALMLDAAGRIAAVALNHATSLGLMGSMQHGTAKPDHRIFRVEIWDLEAGQQRQVLSGHSDVITALALSPDEHVLASASRDRTVRVWALQGGAPKRTLQGAGDAIEDLAFLPDGSLLAACGAQLLQWDAVHDEPVRTLGPHGAALTALAVAPDGVHAVSAAADRTLQVWQLASGRCVRVLSGHTDPIRDVAVTPDGRWVLSGAGDLVYSTDNTLRVWELATGRAGSVLRGHGDRVTAIAALPESQALSASRDGKLRLWRLSEAADVQTLRHSEDVNAVAVTADGRRAVSAADDRCLKVWDAADGMLQRTLGGHASGIVELVLSIDGQRAVCAVGGYKDAGERQLAVWSLDGGELLQRITLDGEPYVRALALTPDGRLAITAGDAGRVRVWDLDRGKAVCEFEGHRGWCFALAVTPDGRSVLSGGADHAVRLWPLDGTAGRTLGRHEKDVTALAVTPDGRHAVSASQDATLRVWDLEQTTLPRTLTAHRILVSHVRISRDGTLAVSASGDGQLVAWSTATWAPLWTLQAHRVAIYDLALSSDGRHAVSASVDETLRVWELASGRELAWFHIEGGANACAAVGGRGLFIAGDRSGGVHFLQLEDGGR